MNPRTIKDSLYEQFARIGRVVAHPKRIEMLDLLCQSERSVEEVARMTTQGMGSASAQLQVLKQARLVETRREGRHIYYRVASDSVCALVQALQETAREQLSEVAEAVRANFDSDDDLEPISMDALRARIDSDMIVVVDVRPVEEYEAGHISGAISVPFDELDERLRGAEIPSNREIVAYCRGPYCVLAPQAAEVMRTSGFTRVRRLDTGFPQWRMAGLPIEVSAIGSSASDDQSRNQETAIR